MSCQPLQLIEVADIAEELIDHNVGETILTLRFSIGCPPNQRKAYIDMPLKAEKIMLGSAACHVVILV